MTLEVTEDALLAYAAVLRERQRPLSANEGKELAAYLDDCRKRIFEQGSAEAEIIKREVGRYSQILEERADGWLDRAAEFNHKASQAKKTADELLTQVKMLHVLRSGILQHLGE